MCLLVQRGFAGKREDDVKMLPERSVVVECGGAGRELSAPINASSMADGALRLAQAVSLSRVEPIVRLMSPAAAVPVPDPPPIRLTAVVEVAEFKPVDDRWNGAALQHVRELRGVTLGQLADRTKVTRHHLENIEADRYDRLPSYIYLRGILLSLAKELRLDALRVCRSYLELAQQNVDAQVADRAPRV